MEHALKKWDDKDAADKTWKNAKNYFSKEYAKRRKHATTEAKQAGFGHANQAKEQTDNELNRKVAEITNEIIQQLKS